MGPGSVIYTLGSLGKPKVVNVSTKRVCLEESRHSQESSQKNNAENHSTVFTDECVESSIADKENDVNRVNRLFSSEALPVCQSAEVKPHEKMFLAANASLSASQFPARIVLANLKTPTDNDDDCDDAGRASNRVGAQLIEDEGDTDSYSGSSPDSLPISTPGSVTPRSLSTFSDGSDEAAGESALDDVDMVMEPSSYSRSNSTSVFERYHNSSATLKESPSTPVQEGSNELTLIEGCQGSDEIMNRILIASAQLVKAGHIDVVESLVSKILANKSGDLADQAFAAFLNSISQKSESQLRSESETGKKFLLAFKDISQSFSIPVLEENAQTLHEVINRVKALTQPMVIDLAQRFRALKERIGLSSKHLELQALKKEELESQASLKNQLSAKEALQREVEAAHSVHKLTEKFAGWTCLQRIASEQRAGLKLQLSRQSVLVRFELIAEWSVSSGELVEEASLSLDYAPLTHESLAETASSRGMSISALRSEFCQQSALLRSLFNFHMPSLNASVRECKTQKQLPALATELNIRLSHFFDMAIEMRELMSPKWRDQLIKGLDLNSSDLFEAEKLEQVSVTVSVEPSLGESSLYPSSSKDFAPFLDHFACNLKNCTVSKKIKYHWKNPSGTNDKPPFIDGVESLELNNFAIPRTPRLHMVMAHGPTLRQVLIDLPIIEAHPHEVFEGKRVRLQTDDHEDAEDEGPKVESEVENAIEGKRASEARNESKVECIEVDCNQQLKQETEVKDIKDEDSAKPQNSVLTSSKPTGATKQTTKKSCILGPVLRQGSRIQVVAAGAVGFADSRIAAQYLRSRAATILSESRGYGRLKKIRDGIIRAFDE